MRQWIGDERWSLSVATRPVNKESAMAMAGRRRFEAFVSTFFRRFSFPSGSCSRERERSERWSWPFINKANGRATRCGEITESTQEMRNDHGRAPVAGTNARRWLSLQGGDGDADVSGRRRVACARCTRFPDNLPRVLEAAGFHVSLYVGGRTAEARCGSLSRPDLASSRSDVAETRSTWLVATRLDADRVGPECGWVYRGLRGQGRGHIAVPERVEDLREWRARQEAAYGAPLVAVACLGPEGICNLR